MFFNLSAFFGGFWPVFFIFGLHTCDFRPLFLFLDIFTPTKTTAFNTFFYPPFFYNLLLLPFFYLLSFYFLAVFFSFRTATTNRTNNRQKYHNFTFLHFTDDTPTDKTNTTKNTIFLFSFSSVGKMHDKKQQFYFFVFFCFFFSFFVFHKFFTICMVF